MDKKEFYIRLKSALTQGDLNTTLYITKEHQELIDWFEENVLNNEDIEKLN